MNSVVLHKDKISLFPNFQLILRLQLWASSACFTVLNYCISYFILTSKFGNYFGTQKNLQKYFAHKQLCKGFCWFFFCCFIFCLGGCGSWNGTLIVWIGQYRWNELLSCRVIISTGNSHQIFSSQREDLYCFSLP